MAPTKDKWVRRFIIPETTRHKKGFTIYKVTSMVFLKSSHEEISKISVWKRYNDFKKLHSELAALHSHSQIKESFPKFPKSKFFSRFETEVIQERRECALKFLEFIGRHSCLYTSDTFIKFFETSHMDSSHDCSQSFSSDTSEDDRHMLKKPVPNNTSEQSILKEEAFKSLNDQSTNIDQTSSSLSQRIEESKPLLIKTNENLHSIEKVETLERNVSMNSSCVQDTVSELGNDQLTSGERNNGANNTEHNASKRRLSSSVQAENNKEQTIAVEESKSIASIHDGSDLMQPWQDSSQYILIAAAHMSAAFRHEAMAEYEEAFTQYKMGISNLLTGVQSDTDTVRAEIIKEKIAKYLERAEKLYNRHLNCNISLLSKPASELQYYKVLKIMRSVMLVKDLRQNCLRIVKAVEKSCGNKESITNYICRGQVPYMVRLYACIETDTTVFLILEYLSRGKLWDFITTEYKIHEDTVYQTSIAQHDFEVALDCNTVVLRESEVQEAKESIDISIETPEFASTSIRVQSSDPQNIEEANEVYGELSTTQLLEKAQILLQSVTATLKESNTIASRLHESEGLLVHGNTTALRNLKNSTYQQEKWDIILTDANEAITESHSITTNNSQNSQQSRLSVKNSLSSDDIKNDRSPDVTDSSSLTDSYTDLSLSEKDPSSYSLENSKSISMHIPIEHTNTVTNNSISDLTRSVKSECNIRENSYLISDDQIQYFDTGLLKEYALNNNLDIEEELWAIPENLIRLWAAEILLALEALHQQEIIVFGLKPDNILLDNNGHVQLTYMVPHQDADLMKHKQPYASPELCMFLPAIPLTTATDIWSFGVILYELIVGNESIVPKFETRHPGLFHSHSIVNIPSKLCENAKSLLINLIRYEPSERMTIPEVKQHPYFEEIDWSSLVNSQM